MRKREWKRQTISWCRYQYKQFWSQETQERTSATHRLPRPHLAAVAQSISPDFPLRMSMVESWASWTWIWKYNCWCNHGLALLKGGSKPFHPKPTLLHLVQKLRPGPAEVQIPTSLLHRQSLVLTNNTFTGSKLLLWVKVCGCFYYCFSCLFYFLFFFLGGKRVSSRKIRYSLGIISVLENIFFLNLEIQWLGVTWLLICYFYIITGWSVIRGKPLCKSWCWVRPFKSFFHILSFLNLSSYVNITTPCHHTYRVPLWYSKSHMRPTQAMEALPSRVYL